MSSERRGVDGIRRTVQRLSAPPGAASGEERWPGANEEKTKRLQLRSLKRQAAAQGLQLRHSAYGYALIDSERKPIKDRNDMTLDEVESCLERR